MALTYTNYLKPSGHWNEGTAWVYIPATNTHYLDKAESKSKAKPTKEIYFIYGTLRANHRNHGLLIREDMIQLHTLAACSGFRLIEVCSGVPGLVHYPEGTMFGEVWEMGERNIELMKRIEQGYTKETISINLGSHNIAAYAWVWANQYDNSQILPYNQWDMSIEQHSSDVGFKK